MRKTVFFAVALLAIIISEAHAQAPNFDWAGGTNFNPGSSVSALYGNTIVADTSYNVYAAGVYTGTVDFDPGPGQWNLSTTAQSTYLIKMDPLGNLLWAKSLGDSGAVLVGSLANDAAGNLYLSGAFTKTTDFDPGPGVFMLTKTGTRLGFVLKLDRNGNFIWAKAFGGNLAYMEDMNLACDTAGNVFATANFHGTVDADPGPGVQNMVCSSSVYPNIFILKLDSSGNYLWNDQISGTNMLTVYSLAADNAGSVYVTGSFMGTADFDPGAGVLNLVATTNTVDAFILKLHSSNGNLDWAVPVGATSMDVGMVVSIDHAGDVYVSGPFGGTVDFDPGAAVYNVTAASNASDIFLLKLNAQGEFVWVRTWTITGCGNGYYCATDVQNNVYMIGNYKGPTDFDPGVGVLNFNTSGPGVSNIFMLKLDTAGTLDWAIEMGSTENAYGYSLVIPEDMSIYSTGVFDTTTDFNPGVGTAFLSATQEQMYMHKLDQSGSAGPLGIHESTAAASVLVYPNPGSGIFHLVMPDEMEKEMVVTDALGKEILRRKIEASNEQIDLTEAPPGVYLLRIAGDQPEVVKLVKEN